MLRNEQIEFHTLINSVTEELNRNRNRSLWWLMNDLQGQVYLISINLSLKRGELQVQGRGIVYNYYSKASINYSREKSCVCGKHCMWLPGLSRSM